MPTGQYIRKPRGAYKDARTIYIPIGPSIAYVELTQGQFSLIDREDADSVGQFNWFAAWQPDLKGFYAVRKDRGTKKRIYLHRYVLGNVVASVDHIFHNTLDNRKSVLREASHQKNCCNRKIRTDNKCGLKGVHKNKSNKWVAQVRHMGKNIYLGAFPSPEEAHAAYCEAAKGLHGDFFTAA